jgi:tRNA pseudouridine55 synthase
MGRMKNNDRMEGVLLVDKPAAMTSHDVVARLRRITGIRQIGHAGTLDPMATGLLLILIARATKASQSLIGLSKRYEGTMKLGVITDSHDSDGAVVETRPVGNFSMDEITALANDFLGDQYQIPPMFSAKKMGGQKLYKLARMGKDVERPPQFIHIGEFTIGGLRGDEVDFSVHCSKGTYVRTLANDFGQRLGCGAHLHRLRRTAIENFSVADSFPLDELETMGPEGLANALIPVGEAIPPRIVQ